MKIPEMQVIDREDGEEEMNVYEKLNIEELNTYDVCMMSGTENSDTKRKQTSHHTGSENVRMRRYRSVTVCLVLLCVLLLTAVIVLCVLINTNNQQFNIKSKNITEERDQLLTKYTSITKERDQLLTKYTNIIEERDQLLTEYTSITEEKDQLLTKYTNITEERDQLLTEYTSITEERDQLLTEYTNITEERDQLLTEYTSITEERDTLPTKYTNITEERDQIPTKYTNITEERDQLLTKYTKLTEKRDQLTQYINVLMQILKADRWREYQSSLYFFSFEKKSWSDSKRYCKARGADLIIINNKEEQDFIKKICGTTNLWIGLSDIDEEGTWKWVDGSKLTLKFWASREPNGKRHENCAETASSEWNDLSCNSKRNWICERKIKIVAQCEKKNISKC